MFIGTAFVVVFMTILSYAKGRSDGKSSGYDHGYAAAIKNRNR